MSPVSLCWRQPRGGVVKYCLYCTTWTGRGGEIMWNELFLGSDAGTLLKGLIDNMSLLSFCFCFFCCLIVGRFSRKKRRAKPLPARNSVKQIPAAGASVFAHRNSPPKKFRKNLRAGDVKNPARRRCVLYQEQRRTRPYKGRMGLIDKLAHSLQKFTFDTLTISRLSGQVGLFWHRQKPLLVNLKLLGNWFILQSE